MIVYGGAVIGTFFLLEILQKSFFLLQSKMTWCSLLRMTSENDRVSFVLKISRARAMASAINADCFLLSPGNREEDPEEKQQTIQRQDRTRKQSSNNAHENRTRLSRALPGRATMAPLSPTQTPNWRGRRSVVTGPVFDGWTSVMSPYFTVIKRQSPTWSHYEGPDQSTPLDLGGDQRAHAVERKPLFFPSLLSFCPPYSTGQLFPPPGNAIIRIQRKSTWSPPAESYIHNPHECHR